MIKNLKKYSILLCLAGALAFAPVSSANAKSYHRGDRLLAAAVGGAAIGLVGAVVGNILRPARTVVVEDAAYIEPMPVVVVHEPHYYRPVRPMRHARHHYRHH
ncbi:MAG: hypothetical protein II938_04455 [Alphaproteobacteria bacterium]|nr:hypothetical protein [Alphaproteobacteria bacterium]